MRGARPFGGKERGRRSGRSGSKAGATALAAAVIGGLLGGAPSAVAAQPPPEEPAPTSPDRESDGSVPPVWPRPQDLRAQGTSVPLGDEVALVADDTTDPYALDALRTLLRDAGAPTVTDHRPGSPLPPRGLVVRADEKGAQKALRALRAPERGDLPTGGYRLAVGRVDGRATVAMAGVGPDGLFHAAQTLRQLATARDGAPSFAGAVVRDWPGTAVRGTTEGFYGTPWTLEQRLAQLDFMGRTKQNRYLYAPGDDPYRQSRWRDPYPAAERAAFRELADRARRNHVTLGWAVSPGQALCFADDGDVKALTRKIDAMWALGARSFQLQFQDVSYSEWHCDADADRFGSGPEAAARAQAHVANAVARHLAERHGAPAAQGTAGAPALSLMPTEYYQDGTTDYRRALADALHARVEVAWTGVGVVPRTITGGELAGARAAFGHPLVTMDNYPVNDYAQDRIFLGPYTGREPAVATGSAALLANSMEQPTASRIPLFTAADYAWNPRGYRPQESWQAAISDLAGGDSRAREAVRALAGNDASSVLGGDESAYLRPLIADVWAGYDGGDRTKLEAAAKRLRTAFRVMHEAPKRLSGASLGSLNSEVQPWLEQLARYGEAGEHAVDLLLAQSRGEGAKAWKAQLDVRRLRKDIAARPATVGKGVLSPFLGKALERADSWTGADRAKPRSAFTEGPSRLTLDLDRAHPLEAVTVTSEPGTGAPPGVEAHVPGEGWRRIGELSQDGWTQLQGKGVRADALRLSWAPDGAAPKVHGMVPWFADSPAAKLRLSRSETDAEIGGGPRTVTAELTAQRPSDVRGRLVVKAPDGIRVDVPEGTDVPRGAAATVPVKVTVPEGTPAGSYDVPLDFGGEQRTLTVRAFPRSGGPDLARGARSSSSGDETSDFPASAAVDGDPGTRWSSTAEDGAWFQVELERPTRVGRVVLHWQDAYAAGYRVQVSADGRRWRTAATVRDGEGGRESVRMDAPDTRFVRIQGDRRGTRFGYSLWSVEAYAVTD
ncbi:beta-N-acetylglucosaminidase domain-containing protein [Streptomyces sp. NPDC004647]|uniref:beta-N-acetylglucosaminidase domain-containing protein n=1 Tax=Streptomyces sp. NPDC004647 TaxID=3154671 RepID=UPI0033AD1BBD